ncbi:hypothetical protein AB0M83_36690 [Amycolatopsis sp. NPDC051106]|uniref:hypothetical protein n=1 Tax=unclassified Amycolatopsis TaxID=2618356 RepID=UPI00342D3B24
MTDDATTKRTAAFEHHLSVEDHQVAFDLRDVARVGLEQIPAQRPTVKSSVEQAGDDNHASVIKACS